MEQMRSDIDSIEQDICRLRDDLTKHIKTKRLCITDKTGNKRSQWDVFNGMCSLTLCSKNQVVGVWFESLGRGAEGLHLYGKKNARLELVFRSDLDTSDLLMDHYRSNSHLGFKVKSSEHNEVNMFIGRKEPIKYHSINVTIDNDCGGSLIIQMRNIKNVIISAKGRE